MEKFRWGIRKVYYNGRSIGFTYCLLTGTQVAVQLNNVYGDSLVLLVQ